jgi:hypothetical protein
MLIKEIGEIKPLLKPFYFTETLNMEAVFDTIQTISSRYQTFNIFTQVNRINIMPYIVIFYLNDVAILKPFTELFDMLKSLVFGMYTGTKDEYCPRMILHNRLLLLDVNPNNNIRYKQFKLYSMSKEFIVLNEDNIDKLDYLQELEIRILKTASSNLMFKLSKKSPYA